MSRYSFDTDTQRWHFGWDLVLDSYYAQTEPLPRNSNNDQGGDVAGTDRVGEIEPVRALQARLHDQVEIPQTVAQRLAADAPPDPAHAAQVAGANINRAQVTDTDLSELTRLHRATIPPADHLSGHHTGVDHRHQQHTERFPQARTAWAARRLRALNRGRPVPLSARGWARPEARRAQCLVPGSAARPGQPPASSGLQLACTIPASLKSSNLPRQATAPPLITGR